MVVERAGQTLTLPVAISETGKIGIRPEPMLRFQHRRYTLGQSIPAGARKSLRRYLAASQGLR
ncbi:MAG: hypothetical protein WKG07_04150 [Hymenobacter sp.]